MCWQRCRWLSRPRWRSQENELIKWILKGNSSASMWIHGRCAINAFIIHNLVAYFPKNKKAKRQLAFNAASTQYRSSPVNPWVNYDASKECRLFDFHVITHSEWVNGAKSVINECYQHIKILMLLTFGTYSMTNPNFLTRNFSVVECGSKSYAFSVLRLFTV